MSCSDVSLHFRQDIRGPKPAFEGRALRGDSTGRPFAVVTGWEGGYSNRKVDLFFGDVTTIDALLDALLDARGQLAEKQDQAVVPV